MERGRLSALLVALCSCLTWSDAAAQQADWESIRDWKETQAHATRAELEDSLSRLEDLARSEERTFKERTVGRVKATTVRSRLEGGDFHPGDAVLLDVRGEAQLSDTFTVVPTTSPSPGVGLDLPLIGLVPLRGVLMSELENHLTTELGAYIRDPALRARRLIRVAITGAVDEPGYHLLPPERPLADVLMQNGLTQDADLSRLRIEREARILLAGQELSAAILEGRSLEQLDLRTGDVVQVAEQGGNTIFSTLGLTVITATVVAGITVLIR